MQFQASELCANIGASFTLLTSPFLDREEAPKGSRITSALPTIHQVNRSIRTHSPSHVNYRLGHSFGRRVIGPETIRSRTSAEGRYVERDPASAYQNAGCRTWAALAL
jgi:hypothetical protein